MKPMRQKLNFAKSHNTAERRQRFLEAYRQRPAIAPAARMAEVHRATIYRWMADDPDFVEAMRNAREARYSEYREQYLVWEAERKRRRAERERELHPMKCANLARARAIKSQKLYLRKLIAAKLQQIRRQAILSQLAGDTS